VPPTYLVARVTGCTVSFGIFLGLAVVAGCMPPSWGANALLHPGRRPATRVPVAPREDLRLAGDGVTLVGWRVRARPPRRGTVVYLHGVGDNRGSAAWAADHLHARGFDVLAYDSRAHGESTGEACSYGFHEKRDLARVLGQVAPGPVILLGNSMGAAVALQAAADEPRVTGVVAVATISDLRTAATERAPWIASRRNIADALDLAAGQGRFRVDEVSPVAAAARIRCPVLLIHGTADRETPPAHSQRVFAALPEARRRLLLVPGAGHDDALRAPTWKQVDAWMDGVAAAAASGEPPARVEVPHPPTPVVGDDGRTYLGYEVHVVHAGAGALGDDVRLVRLAVFGDDATAPLLVLEGAALADRVIQAEGPQAPARAGAAASGKAGTAAVAVVRGGRALVRVWLAVPDAAPAPRSLRHELRIGANGGEQTVRAADVSLPTTAPAVLGPPLRSGVWLVHEGPGNHRSHHWGSQLATAGRFTIPQRFAIDFIALDDRGRAVRGDHAKSQNADWIGHGAEVVAAADGVVRAARGDVAENRPLAPLPAPASITAGGVYGNHVIIEIAGQRFLHYAHLRPGSVRVASGDRVRRGQLLGLVGNSGNSSAPHLHFHVSDAASFEASEGLPFVLRSFGLRGRSSPERAVGAAPGGPWPPPAPRAGARQLPRDGAVVQFPGR
jgi:alpha-beta hydrolase superfamily lysophospholipase/murein DD-endopeptidase MepM/ murein hydrolase activator NlpD